MTNVEIGYAAGDVYEFLADGEKAIEDIESFDSGTSSTKALRTAALGWLAREGKVEITVRKRKTYARLKDEAIS